MSTTRMAIGGSGRRNRGGGAGRPNAAPEQARFGQPSLRAEPFAVEKIEQMPVASLRGYERNARTHSEKQMDQLAVSIDTFGFNNPVIVDAEGIVVAGHGRLAAARKLGLATVPTIRLHHLTPERIRAFRLADNRLAEQAGWDRELLAIELQELTALKLDFEIEVTGFETATIDLLIEGQVTPAKTDPADEVPQLVGCTVSRPGDMWCLGAKQRLLCGSALEPASYRRLLGDELARACFTDPPFNVSVTRHVCGLGRVKHPEFTMASGEMSEAEFTQFLGCARTCLGQSVVDGGLIYTCIDWRHLKEIMAGAEQARLSLINLCVWNKTNGGMGSFYRSKHELVFVFRAGTLPHLNTIELGRHGRYRTNVWDYPGINSFKRDRDAELAMHPTVKPVALVADAIKDCSRRGEIILDGFTGSGTTLIASEKTGRCGRGIELDPRYVDVAIERWQRLTGQAATHADTGESFAEMAARRVRSTADDGSEEQALGSLQRAAETADV